MEAYSKYLTLKKDYDVDNYLYATKQGDKFCDYTLYDDGKTNEEQEVIQNDL